MPNKGYRGIAWLREGKAYTLHNFLLWESGRGIFCLQFAVLCFAQTMIKYHCLLVVNPLCNSSGPIQSSSCLKFYAVSLEGYTTSGKERRIQFG